MNTIYSKPIFSISHQGFGTVTIRKFNLKNDCLFLHRWINLDYAVFWGLQGSSLKEVEQEYAQLTEPEHYDVFVGEVNGEPAFVLERYLPVQDLIAQYYSAQTGDRGIHIIIAPPQKPKVDHFSWYVFKSIMEFVFRDETIDRILVEPDIRNKKMFAICMRMGFMLDKIVELPHKTAQLAFLERTDFEKIKATGTIVKRSEMNKIDNSVGPQQAIEHLSPTIWQKANRLLIKKAICEFSHERLCAPKVLDHNSEWSTYSLQADDATVVYSFRAKKLSLNHLLITSNSIRKTKNNVEQELDAVFFIKEFKLQLGISDQILPVYLEEIISTLQGSAYKIAKGNPTARELVNADFQTIEQSMTEGHPCFVANNGRIGFDSSDYRAYAPETGNSFSLMWLAGHRSHTKYEGLESLSYETTIQQELEQEAIDAFNQTIVDKGFSPADYLFIPIHPWQWFNKLAHVYAPEIAKGKLICLGYGKDQYLAQQSVRTLFNISNPQKFYTKSSLSILNMGFMRGLPYYYLGTAPKMVVWLEELLYNDPFIASTGFKMLGEVASVSYINPYFEEFGAHNDYNKMLASLWRESPYQYISEGQQLMTMAAFLHVDDEQVAFLPQLIKASGQSIEQWLAAYFDAYLIPLLHCFYKYDLVFMPHGENIIVVLENHLPKHIFMKDITEEAVILDVNAQLPDSLERMRADVPENIKLLSFFIDIFDDYFRFMVHILEEHTDFKERDFWRVCAKQIKAYQNQCPELQHKFLQYDLFTESFQLSCLNRLQFNDNKQMIDLDDPVALLQFNGNLTNPLAPYKSVPELSA